MYDVSADTDAAVAIMGNMIDDLAKMQKETLPTEFYNWQAEDMHRHYPETDTSQNTDGVAVSTMVYPRSRKPRPYAAKRLKPRSTMPVKRVARPAGSQRPILRPELFRLLVARMDAMLDAIGWRKRVL